MGGHCQVGSGVAWTVGPGEQASCDSKQLLEVQLRLALL